MNKKIRNFKELSRLERKNKKLFFKEQDGLYEKEQKYNIFPIVLPQKAPFIL